MKWNQLVQLVLNEREYEYDGLEVGFRFHGNRYIVIGRVDYDTDEKDWDNWNIEVWDIYERDVDESKGEKIQNPPEDMVDVARDALRDMANEKGIEAGHFEDETDYKPEREFNYEDLDDKDEDEEKNFDELKVPFTFRENKYYAYGDVSMKLNEAEVKLYAVLDLDGDELDRPLPEMIRDAQYALQDHARSLLNR